jgi:hypothetical protein
MQLTMENKPLIGPLVAALIVASTACLTGAETVFKDGFEAGLLGPGWEATASNDGRCTVTPNYMPATGQWQLVLDDGVNDAVYSVAEASLQLNLSHKKNVTLSFKAKSLGNEPDIPPSGNFTTARNFDGVSISTDGGTTWRVVQSLANVGVAWETYSLLLDGVVTALGGSFGENFRIRFSQFDNAAAPLDGIAIDEVQVTADDAQQAVLELPTPLLEGTGPHTGYAMLAFASTNATTLYLSASPGNQLALPATATVPSGQTVASFTFSVLENNLVDLTRSVTVTATAPNVASSPATVTILDNDAPVGTLTLPPQVVEGQLPTNNAVFSIDRVTAVPFQVNLAAVPVGELTLPASITVAAGQTQVVFTVRAVDDVRIDGDIQVGVMATNPAMALATGQILVLDNEAAKLSLNLPVAVPEGGTATGTVSIPGTLTNALEVKLTSDNEAALTVSATATIPAGQTNGSFTLAAMDNTLRDGSRSVDITAAASGFTGGQRSVVIRDNDPASYRFNAMPDIVNISSPLAISIQAADVEGNVISNLVGAVSLSVVLPDGTTRPMNPASVNLSGGNGWTGSVAFPAVASAPLRLRASDGRGATGDSLPFDILRVLNLTAADLAWDSVRNRLYASVPANASDTNANRIVAINPGDLQFTGSALTAQNPGQLVLTSAGEYLYVALNANGSVARLDPATMNVVSSFAVGTDPNYGTLYAADMCAVAGQPNLIVVSQKRTSVSPQHNGVAVYDNGVRRPNKTQDHTGSNVIEPSADPTLFFGYNTESTEYGFRQLRLDANGMTEIQVNGSLINGFSLDIRADGNKVFSTSGAEVDGVAMRRVGTFGVSGQVRPDQAANRVYFLESNNDRIGAYDPTTFNCISKAMLPAAVPSPASFIRWGTNGLAFRSGTNVYLISSSRLVPSGAPANVTVTVQAAPNPATVSTPLTYTVCVSNRGPNTALSANLGAVLSANQILQAVASSQGAPVTTNSAATLFVGDLAAGASATLTLTVLPQSAGSLTCTASATSQSVDPDFTDNTAAKLVSVGFESAPDSVNRLQLTANNLVYDPTRNRLWASIPETVSGPLGRSIVSIDPVTGLMSDPLAINASPMPRCMALAANGRYLYVGLSDSPEVLRLDLTTIPPTSLRIPMGLSQWGDANYAEDIEPLDGDGTSFLMAGSDDHAAAVFDGVTRRSGRTGIYTVDCVERTGTPGLFVGYNNYTSGYDLSSLSVTAEGVAITRSVRSLISGYYVQVVGAGNLALSSTGVLADSINLVLKCNFGVSGRPCLDFPYQRAYLVNGNLLRGFDTTSSLSVGTFSLPTTQSGDWAQTCIRWGLDGFAILGNDGIVYIVRWSAAIPASVDSNHNGIPDAWEAVQFLSLGVNMEADGDKDGISNAMEYLFGTSPTQPNISPLQVSVSNLTGRKSLRLVFPRRAGLTPCPYAYETSEDLKTWAAAQDTSETVLGTQVVNGVQLETVEALFPATNSLGGFVRIKWLGR